jgi:anti-sigma B factor antagonist
MAEGGFKHIAVAESQGVAVVEFVGSQLMFATAVVDEIGNELGRLLTNGGHTRLVLDFSNVQYVGSIMLAKLAMLQRQAEAVQGQIKLCRLGPVLKDTFRIGQLDRVFDIYDDVKSAVDAF